MHYVRVPAQVLGGRVQHYISTEVQRVLQVRRGESIIANKRQLMFLSYGCTRGNINDIQQWISRRFYPYHLCIGVNIPGNVLCILHAYEVELNAVVGKYLCHDAVSAA